jgi:hypothetical protein
MLAIWPQYVGKRIPVVIRSPFSERGVLLYEHRRDLSTNQFEVVRDGPQWGWNRAAAFPIGARRQAAAFPAPDLNVHFGTEG